MSWLSAPYSHLIAPALPLLLSLLASFLVLCLLVSLWRSEDSATGVATPAYIVAALLALIARWGFAGDSSTAAVIVAVAVVALLFGFLFDRPRSEFAEGAFATPWHGWMIIAAATVVKCFRLAEWPAHLNAYSAETAWVGIEATLGVWPDELFGTKAVDLVNGGVSPLHLPLMWLSAQVFGGNVFSARFAEVIGSTLLLILFWAWLRRHARGVWSLVALAVFAFSPWHIAQSRMGTFQSISSAVAIGMLWVGEKLVRGERRLGWWALFGTGAGLIGYCYAPVKIVYVLFAFVLVRVTWRARRETSMGWWIRPLVSVAVFLALLFSQIGGATNISVLLQQEYGPLATDTSVFHKTPDGEVTMQRQSLFVAARNVVHNVATAWHLSWIEPGILSWYAVAVAAVLVLAVPLLMTRARWLAPWCCLLGALPPLAVYPLSRRALVMSPLVYVGGVLLLRELVRHCSGLIDSRLWRHACGGLAALCLIASTLHGLHVYATTNSVVLTGTYFGPNHRLDMMQEARWRLATCRVWFANLTSEDQLVARVRLFEDVVRSGDDVRLRFIELSPEVDVGDLPRDQPLCVFVMHEAGDDLDALDRFAQQNPGGQMVRRVSGDGSAEPMYNLYILPVEEPS